MSNDNKFQEQSAPEKNTDKAYVQVGEDGKPVMPGQKNNNGNDDITKQNEDAEKATTLGNP